MAGGCEVRPRAWGCLLAATVILLGADVFTAQSSRAQAPTVDLMSPAPVSDWTGLHVGGFGFWSSANVDADPLYTGAFGGNFYYPPGGSYSFSDDQLGGGIQAGLDRQWGSFVIGLAGEIAYLGFDKTIEDPNFLPSPFFDGRAVTTFKGKWYGSLTGRVGVAWNRVLLYARGGFAVLHAEATTVDTCGRGPCGVLTIDAKGDDPMFGWTAGGGAEVALNNNLTFGAEYRYFDFQALKVSGIASNLLLYSQDIEFDFHQVRAFVNYRW